MFSIDKSVFQFHRYKRFRTLHSNLKELHSSARNIHRIIFLPSSTSTKNLHSNLKKSSTFKHPRNLPPSNPYSKTIVSGIVASKFYIRYETISAINILEIFHLPSVPKNQRLGVIATELYNRFESFSNLENESA